MQGTDEVALIAVVLLPVAVITSGYALLVYYWRSNAITAKTNLYYDDRRGPLALTLIVVLALICIFCISFADLISMLRGGRTFFL